MKFKEYVESLNNLLKERPETGEFDVVAAEDGGGNGFNLVHYGPSVGNYDSDKDEFDEEGDPNAVCVN